MKRRREGKESEGARVTTDTDLAVQASQRNVGGPRGHLGTMTSSTFVTSVVTTVVTVVAVTDL